MTFTEFIAKYNGKGIDYDGAYGDQCMDLYRQYVKEVLQLPQSPGVVGAKDVWDTYLKEHYTRVPNTPSVVPQEGDIMIWGKELGNIYGHISVFIEGDTNSFKSFDQNWPVGSKCHVQNHDYKAVLGWLHPKKNVIIPPMTCEIEKAEIVKLNTEIGRTIVERDTARKDLAAQKLITQSTVDELNATKLDREKIVGEKKVLEQKITQAKAVLG